MPTPCELSSRRTSAVLPGARRSPSTRSPTSRPSRVLRCSTCSAEHRAQRPIGSRRSPTHLRLSRGSSCRRASFAVDRRHQRLDVVGARSRRIARSVACRVQSERCHDLLENPSVRWPRARFAASVRSRARCEPEGAGRGEPNEDAAQPGSGETTTRAGKDTGGSTPSDARVGHMNFRRLNARMSSFVSMNHSPFVRCSAKRLCQYASMPLGSSVAIT